MSCFVRNPLIQQMTSVRWSDSSAAEISQLLNYCYQNDLSLHYDFGWEVGARRRIQLSNPTTYARKSAYFDFTLLDFNDDSSKIYQNTDGSYPKAIVGCLQDVVTDTTSARPTGLMSQCYPEDYIYNQITDPQFKSLFKQFGYNGRGADNIFGPHVGHFTLFCWDDIAYGTAQTTQGQSITTYAGNGGNRRLKYFESPSDFPEEYCPYARPVRFASRYLSAGNGATQLFTDSWYEGGKYRPLILRDEQGQGCPGLYIGSEYLMGNGIMFNSNYTFMVNGFGVI